MKNHFYKPGDLLLYDMPYTDPKCSKVLSKVRPVIVLRNMEDDMCIVMQVSTMKNKKYLTKYDILLKHNKYKRFLDRECYVQPHKTFIVNQYSLRHGKVPANLFEKNPRLFKKVLDNYIEFQKETIYESVLAEERNRNSYMLRNATLIKEHFNDKEVEKIISTLDKMEK